MIIYGLDAEYQTVKMMRYTNLQWRRRYYETGSFELQTLMADYDPAVKYLYTNERPELGVVQKVQTDETIKGKFVMLSGYFAECLLNRDIIYPKTARNGDVVGLAKDLINTYATSVCTFNADYVLADVYTAIEYEGVEVGKAAQEMLKPEEFSVRIWLDGAGLKCKLWRGLDRTQGQSVNNYALFSDGCMSAGSFGYAEDDSGYKNYAVIKYGDNATTYVDVRESADEPMRKLFVDKGGATAMDEIKQYAKEQLEQSKLVREVAIDVTQAGLIYRADYDLGDKCDLVHTGVGKSFEARITEIDEVWKKGEHSVVCRFGEQAPTSYQKIIRQLRNMKGGR